MAYEVVAIICNVCSGIILDILNFMCFTEDKYNGKNILLCCEVDVRFIMKSWS